MQSTEDTIQIRRKTVLSLIVLPLFSGFAAFVNMLENPRFQHIRSVDVVRLIAIGACWGVGVAGLALLIGSKFHKG